jgi:dGTP triphosphohydrolase
MGNSGRLPEESMAKRKATQGKVKAGDEQRRTPQIAKRSAVMLPSPSVEAAIVDKALVNDAVNFINEKANETLYRGSEEIGAYLLERFFGNDIAVASSRNPHKPASYTALCQRADLAVHPATLSLMVRVAAQEVYFKQRRFNAAGLSYTHKAELVKLPNTAEKIRLAQKALKSTLTSRLLSEEVKKTREKSGAKGKVISSVIEKYMTDPVRLFENARRNDFLSNADNLKKIRRETRQKLLEKALEMVQKTKEWGKRYRALAKELEKIG